MFHKSASYITQVLLGVVILGFSTPAFCQVSNLDSVSQVIENFGSPGKGIYRGAQPSEEGFKALKELGVKTVINFRNENKKVQKEKELVESLGMQYISIPWDGRQEPAKKDVNQFIEIVKNSDSQPVFFHCRRGAERTGVMWASYRVAVDGWDPDKASGEMKKYDFRAFWFPHLTKFLYDFSRDYGFEKEYTKSRFTKAKTWFLTRCVYSPFTKRANA